MGQVVVCEYNPFWAVLFDELHACFAKNCGDLLAGIEHVGSTSVPGLPAKPVIDIDLVLKSPSRFSETKARLESLGYEHRGNLGIPERESFKEPSDSPFRHNLYVCNPD